MDKAPVEFVKSPRKGILQPQEIEVFYIIPTLRKYLAIALKERGMKQTEIAKLLDIENATVSQYIKGKRGNKVSFNKIIENEIKRSAQNINDKISLLRETQRLLRMIKHTGELCAIHKRLSQGIPCNCNPALTGCFKPLNEY